MLEKAGTSYQYNFSCMPQLQPSKTCLIPLLPGVYIQWLGTAFPVSTSLQPHQDHQKTNWGTRIRAEMPSTTISSSSLVKSWAFNERVEDFVQKLPRTNFPTELKELLCIFWWHAIGIFGILVPQHQSYLKDGRWEFNPGRIFVLAFDGVENQGGDRDKGPCKKMLRLIEIRTGSLHILLMSLPPGNVLGRKYLEHHQNWLSAVLTWMLPANYSQTHHSNNSVTPDSIH